jgi:anaerobic magnesium-protoporphyrin IX monomethyl ester cyclase
MRTLLTTLNAKYIHINLAIRLLFELNQDQEGLEWKEFTIKESKDDVARFCADFDVVAFSCYIWNITQTLEVARKIKALHPDTKILLGGPEVSYDWKDIIALPEVDFIITGEGETPFRTFLTTYPTVDMVPNLVRKVSGEVIYFPNSEIFDLENYRGLQPYRHDPVAELRTKVLYIETSRGCPYKCEFCLASLDNKVRYLPNETIKAHLKYLMDHGRVIKFLDRTFNIKRDFTIDIFRFILDNYRPGNVFQFEITADIIHPEIIKFIHDHVPAGLFRFEIGIQTVNQKANLEVSRKQNFEKTKGIILQLQDKVEMHLDLIVGLALDYWDDIKYSFEEVFKLFAPELQLGFLKFLKGTPMREKLAEHQFVYDSNPPYQIIESKYLSREELHKIELLEHALEIYWNKNRAAHTLRYVTATYSIFDFLMELGTFFGEIKPFHAHILEDVYTILNRFVREHYPEDEILHELVALDYYLFHKTIPKSLFISEVPKEEKITILDLAGLDTSKYRYTILPFSFDVQFFQEQFSIVREPSCLIIAYEGITKSSVSSFQPTTHH